MWNEGSSAWTPLDYLKDSSPLDAAELSIARGIDNRPAFTWLVLRVLKKRNSKTSAAILRAKKFRYEHGIERYVKSIRRMAIHSGEMRSRKKCMQLT